MTWKLTRETLYQDLFARLSLMPELKTKSRRLKHWADVPPVEQPALFQVQVSEAPQITSGKVRWLLRVDLFLYVHSTDPIKPPSQVMNPLLDSLEGIISPDITGNLTLGNRVVHCRLAGAIETAEGALGDQEIAIVPLEILTYSSKPS